MDFIKTKVEDVNKLALRLGIDKRTELEQAIFKEALFQIAVTAIDDTRSKIGDLMSVQSNAYTNSALEK